ncbi:hypothetical protein NQ318_000521 [Aromia moschata]|uniref:EGF-like domain-containing protein n=1 Tax=Aromia moschata TaxID=1265417 RepID=A0AAV8YGD5_9CUCU|nr:hypothetical protein NQ318_000521 [Aromia moschata]
MFKNNSKALSYILCKTDTDADRRYVCQCNPGYVGNGTICREISRYEGNFLLVNQGMATLKIPPDSI